MRLQDFGPRTIVPFVSVILLALALNPGGEVHAQPACDHSWTSAVSGNWNDASKWTGGVPSAGNNACIQATGASYTVTLNVHVQAAGALGSFTLDSANATFSSINKTFTVNGPSTITTGSVLWQSSTWTGTGTFTNNANGITVQGNSTISTNSFVQNGLLVIRGVGGLPGFLTIPGSFPNTGTIDLESTHQPSGLFITLGTLTNAATGIINFKAGVSSLRTLRAGLINDGTVNIGASDTRFDLANGVTTNNSAFNILAGGGLTFSPITNSVFNQNGGTLSSLGTFGMFGDTFNFNGGTVVNNPPVLQSSASINATLNIATNGAGSFTMQGTGNFSGNLALGQTLTVKAVPGLAAIVTAANGFTNGGTIILVSTGNGGAALIVTAGVLTNAATGIINLAADIGIAARTLRTDLINNGIVNISTNDSRLDKANGVATNNNDFNIGVGGVMTFSPVTNSIFNQNGGTMSIAGSVNMSGDTFNFNGGAMDGGGTLNLNSNSTFFGAGTAAIDIISHNSSFSPGFSTGIVNLIPDSVAATGGNYTQNIGGFLNIDIGGPVPGTGHDQANMTNNADLTGTLNVDFINGFNPNPCDRFQIATYGSRTGAIPTMNVTNLPAGLFLRADFNATDLTLVALSSVSNINISPTSINVAEGGTTSDYQICLGSSTPPGDLVTVSPAPDSQVTVLPSAQTFDPASDDWKQTKPVTVTAVDDPAVEGLHIGLINHSSSSGDPNFDIPSAPTVTANITDNDFPDDDADGVFNPEDQCPDTPQEEPVDADGCSESQLDDDSDGVDNAADQCPDTPIKDPVDANGCSEGQRDDDGDGVDNATDQCPDTPPEDSVDENGCSVPAPEPEEKAVGGTPSFWESREGPNPAKIVAASGVSAFSVLLLLAGGWYLRRRWLSRRSRT
ncbi:MAG: beta strand repeat-containing protein [Dehalococcoidia bacterium]